MEGMIVNVERSPTEIGIRSHILVIFVNDLPDGVNKEYIMYVFGDDTKLSRGIIDAVYNKIWKYDIAEMDSWSVDWLTHRGQVTHICVSKLTIIGSDNGLSPGRRQAII